MIFEERVHRAPFYDPEIDRSHGETAEHSGAGVLPARPSKPRGGIPSRDTPRDVMDGLDAALFETCFAEWVETRRGGLPDIIARDGRTSHRLSSTRSDAKTFANGVRTQWRIENRPYRTLDVVFHDGLVRPKTGDGPENMAIIRTLRDEPRAGRRR